MLTSRIAVECNPLIPIQEVGKSDMKDASSLRFPHNGDLRKFMIESQSGIYIHGIYHLPPKVINDEKQQNVCM